MSKCCICGATDDLRIAPIMTGDRIGEKPRHPVCGPCVQAWFESGETTAEEILRYRQRQADAASRVVVSV